MTRRGRASRERIVEPGAELFAGRGIAATSVDEVLAAGGGQGPVLPLLPRPGRAGRGGGRYRCAQVVAGLREALGGVSSLAGLEQALAASCRVRAGGAAGVPDRDAGDRGRRPQRGCALAGGRRVRCLGAVCWRTRWSGCASAGNCARTRRPPCWPRDCWPASRRMVLSQARKDMASLRTAVEAGLGRCGRT